MLQSSQAGAQGGGEEAIVAYLHKATWQNVLKKTLDEMLHGESTGPELSGVRGAILESDLGSLHTVALIDRNQAPVANGDAVDVGGQVFEGSLPIADWLAVDNPFPPPDFWRDFRIERRCS